MNDSINAIRESLRETCQALREIYDPLRPSIEMGFGQVTALLDRPEAYRYRVHLSDDYLELSDQFPYFYVDTEEAANKCREVLHVDTGESIVERIVKELTPAALEAREYQASEPAFTLDARVSDFEIIANAIETPLQLGEVIVALADVATVLDAFKQRVDSSQKGGEAGPNGHPVNWSGTGATAYFNTLGEFSGTLDILVGAADELTSAAGNLLSSVNSFLLSLAELGSMMKSNLTSMVADLAGNVSPIDWLGILRNFAGAVDDARSNRETLLRDMANAADSNIQALINLLPTARDVARDWPKVDGNINGGPGSWTP